MERRLVIPESRAIDMAQLFSTIGLMLDMEQYNQLFHSWRVAAVAYRLAQEMIPLQAPNLYLAAMVQDIGAVHFERHVIHELLDNPATVGQKARLDLFFHPLVGFDSLRVISGLRQVALYIKEHHECYSGEGYPDGLVGEGISLGGRILRAADLFDQLARSETLNTLDKVKTAFKPYIGEDLDPTVHQALMDMLSGGNFLETVLHSQKLSEYVECITDDLRGYTLFERISEQDRSIETLGDIIDRRNAHYHRGHTRRVSMLSDDIAEALHLSEDDRVTLRWASAMQNMGELATGRSTLGKTGRLDEGEFALIKAHPEIGFRLIDRVEKLHEVALTVLHHHENYDGSGYPRGLYGGEIPLLSRILRVADTFDALTGERPYNKRKDWKRAIKELKKNSGKQFDPQVVAAATHILS